MLDAGPWTLIDSVGKDIVPRSIFIVAGEVSGDLSAAHLVRELRRRDPTIRLVGVGGPRMAAAGVAILRDSSTWGAIGHLDPLLRIRAYLRRLRAVEAAIRDAHPDLLLLVDFPAFNLRLAERLHGVAPVAYYFPPMVSVRKGNRAARVAPLGMRLLATLRREEEAYLAAGADVVFIGHPVVDMATVSWDGETARARFGIPAGSPVVGLLPGSRLQEVRAHLAIMLRAAAGLRGEFPDLWFVLPMPTTGFVRMVEPAVTSSGLPIRIVTDVYEAMSVASVLVTATGTATLEGTVLGIPMVAVYRLPWVSWFIALRIVSVRHAALPNILAGREIVPEFLQARMTPRRIADAVGALLRDPARRQEMRADLQRVAADLGPPGAIARAAAEIMALLRRDSIASARTGR